MTIDNNSLAAFRFQVFCEDIIYPLVGEQVDLDENMSLFVCGELREAVAMAALGVACGLYPRELFSRMLDMTVRDKLDGTWHQFRFAGRYPEGWPPPPINDLPNSDDVLTWSRAEVYEATIGAMPEVMDSYTSLMRQVRRNDFHRKFNAELLFAKDETWQEEVRALRSAMIPWITGAVEEPECIWLPEGLDSFFDLAEDLGINVETSTSGEFVGFKQPHPIGALNAEIVGRMAASDSLRSLTAWRFGGATYAERVTQRVLDLQSLVSAIVAIVESGSLGGQIRTDIPFRSFLRIRSRMRPVRVWPWPFFRPVPDQTV